MGEFQPTHILLVILVALLLFGGPRVAGLGKGLGQAIKNFKAGMKDTEEAEGDEGNAGNEGKKEKA
jgi:sec-independent protein translocase protein TatA